MKKVALFMGAWIETLDEGDVLFSIVVALFMGAWIETPQCMLILPENNCRTLHGCGD